MHAYATLGRLARFWALAASGRTRPKAPSTAEDNNCLKLPHQQRISLPSCAHVCINLHRSTLCNFVQLPAPGG
eukprot:15435766-Alexandrium_andersonii.AAC.1